MFEFLYRLTDILVDYIFTVSQYIDQGLYAYGFYDMPMSFQNALWLVLMALVVGVFFLFFYLAFVLIRAIFGLFWR